MDPIEIVSATGSVAPIIQQAADYGVANVLVGLMVWMIVSLTGLIIWRDIFSSKAINKVLADLNVSVKLQQVSLTNLESALNNTSKALEILGTNMNHLAGGLERIEKKFDFMNGDVKETATLIRRRPCIHRREGDPNYD